MDFKEIAKKIKFPLFAGVFIVLFNAIFLTIQLHSEKAPGRGYLMFLAIAVVFIVLIVLFIRKNIKLEALTAFALIFFGIACMFIFPPATVPDEPSHFRSAYHISNNLMLNFKDEQNGLYMRQEDSDFIRDIPSELQRDNYDYTLNNDYFFCKNSDVVKTGNKYMTGKTVVYIVPAIGITIARLIGLSAYFTFQLGRLFNFALFVIAVYYAIKLMPFGKQMIAVVALIPQNLHIMSSVSYDVFTTSGVLLMFAYIMHIMYSDKKITWKHLLILAVLIVLVVPQKIVYIGVAAIVLIIPKKQFAHPRWHFLFKLGLGVLAVVSIFALQMGNASKMANSVVTYSNAEGYDFGFLISNPIASAKLLFNTFLTQSDFYIKSLIAFFGWFDTEIPWFLTIPVIVVVFVSFMRREGEPASLKIHEKLYALMLFGVVWLFVELILMMDWTPMGSPFVQGVQGRYFIPALPLLFLLFRNDRIVVKKDLSERLILAMSVINAFVFSDAIRMIMVR